jgi:hypothetical protein
MGTTRRAVLGGGALLGALANVAAFRSLAASSFDRGEGVLYTYPGARAGTTVLAARWSAGSGGLARIRATARGRAVAGCVVLRPRAAAGIHFRAA